MTRKSGSDSPAHRLAVAQACAKTLLLALGVDSSDLPDIGTVLDSPAPIVRSKAVLERMAGARFRRTDQEIEECKALEAWQQARRNGASDNFVVESS